MQDPVEILVDVQELPAPEPLIRVLDSLSLIENGKYIHMIHRREPCKLFEKLDSNVYYYRSLPIDANKHIVWICLQEDSPTIKYLEQKIP